MATAKVAVLTADETLPERFLPDFLSRTAQATAYDEFAEDVRDRYAPRRPSAPVALSGSFDQPGGRDRPTLSNPLDKAIITRAAQSAPTLYWPWIVDMRDFPQFGYAYALYYSTDHDAGAGGIYCIGMDDALGTNAVNLGRVYVDTVSGIQTETPSVMKLPDGRLAMYYQQGNVTGASGQQSTMLAISTNGVNWVRQGIMLDRPADITMSPGNGHTGYFRPILWGGRYYGWSLYGGTSRGYKALWTSFDGITWNIVKVLGRQTESIVNVPGFANDWQWSWINSACVLWQGRVWMFSQIGPTTSGANAGAAKRIFAAPLTDDLCSLATPPIDVTPAAQSWEVNGIEQLGNVVANDNRLFLAYRTAVNGGFGIKELDL